MIKTIFLDMDGVICDFRKQCEKFHCIDKNQVNWEIIYDEGPEFWENIEWTKDGLFFYKWLRQLCKEENIDLYILTSVNFRDGKIGKLNWLKKNIPEFDTHHILITNKGKEKALYANNETLLVDDFGKNCKIFEKAGGIAIKFENAAQAKNDIASMLIKR